MPRRRLRTRVSRTLCRRRRAPSLPARGVKMQDDPSTIAPSPIASVRRNQAALTGTR